MHSHPLISTICVGNIFCSILQFSLNLQVLTSTHSCHSEKRGRPRSVHARVLDFVSFFSVSISFLASHSFNSWDTAIPSLGTALAEREPYSGFLFHCNPVWSLILFWWHLPSFSQGSQVLTCISWAYGALMAASNLKRSVMCPLLFPFLAHLDLFSGLYSNKVGRDFSIWFWVPAPALYATYMEIQNFKLVWARWHALLICCPTG